MLQKTTEVFQDFKKFIHENSPANYSILLAIPLIFLIIGFFIWKIYLYTFGFDSSDLLRGQFILTGMLFVIISVVIVLCAYKFIKIFSRIAFYFDSILLCTFLKEKLIFLSIFLIIIWFLFYTLQIFPLLPLYVGGGQPRALSLIAKKENMEILGSIQVTNAEGAQNQTLNLCVAYEDNQRFYVIMSDRLLAIDKSLTNGVASVPGVSVFIEEQCVEWAKYYSGFGFKASNQLLFNNIINFFGQIFKLKPLHLEPEKINNSVDRLKT
jgi:hypothetical protein